MAMRAISSRLKLSNNTTNNTQWKRLICSINAQNEISESKSFVKPKGNLKRQIFGLKFPRFSATNVIQNWVKEGHTVSASQLRFIATQLVELKRYKHALEILTWMETEKSAQMTAADYAMRMEAIVKLRGLMEAEQYFESLSSTLSRKATCFSLLHGYVKEKDNDKAEAFMKKIVDLGLAVTPHPFNEMMKLYMATFMYEKVLLVISLMKRNRIALNVLSYNIWMNACSEISGPGSVEMVYSKMLSDKNVEVGWSTFCTMANAYTKAGVVDKAVVALKYAEKKLSTSNRFGYFFLITIYASLKDREGVIRLWEASKAVDGRMTCANYMCLLSCLLKVGDLREAERVFEEWETNSRNYDIRVSNILLGAYMRNGLVDKAESLHLHTLERGGCPNYKTWEILVEGWLKSQNMEKAIEAMKKGLSMLKRCEWRPAHGILMAIAEYFEKNQDIEVASWYIREIHRLGLGSLALYKIFLRMHLCAKRSASDILKMMEKDKIEMDQEASTLVQEFNS